MATLARGSSLATDNFADVARVNTETLSQNGERCSGTRGAADFSDILMLQPVPTPQLGSHVSHVLDVGGRKQVTRIAARRIVAAMADVERGGEGSKRERPRHSMRSDWAATHLNSAVLVRAKSPRPRPACVRRTDFDSLPKTFGKVVSGDPSARCVSLQVCRVFASDTSSRTLSPSVGFGWQSTTASAQSHNVMWLALTPKIKVG